MKKTFVACLLACLVLPAGAALGCALVRSRRMMAALGVLAFGLTLAGGVALLRRVAAGGVVGKRGALGNLPCAGGSMLTAGDGRPGSPGHPHRSLPVDLPASGGLAA